MPKVDMDMTSGTIAVWHVAEGAEVESGDPLFDIETDKAAMEVESPASGRLHHILAEAGSEVAIGKAIAWIYAPDEEVGPPPDNGSAAPAPETPDTAAGAVTTAPQRTKLALPVSPDHPAKPRATPAARRLARENALDLAEIAGSGPAGRIARGDVETALRELGEQPPAAASGWQPEGGPLVVHRAGGNTGAPLVMIHGFAADSAGWQKLEACLPSDRPVVSIDLPGHGKSPRRPVDSFRSLARMVVEAFDAEDLDGAHLVGHSLGAALALALADVRPRRIASLTMIAPAGLGPETNGAVLAGLARAGRKESLAPWLKQLTAEPQIITESFVMAAMQARKDPALRAYQQDLAETLFPDSVQSFDLTPALDRLAIPAQIVWGRKDRVFPWKQALQAPGRVALHLLHDTGHMPHLEAPEEVAAVIASRLQAAAGQPAVTPA